MSGPAGAQASVQSVACRRAFASTLLEAARSDPSLYAVTSDARGSVTLTDFAQALPRQFLEIGIAEQNAVGVAAGLALAGKRPFVCGPACFYSARSIEQFKNDVAYSNLNVKVIGVSGGVSYGALGSTHHSLHDIAFLRAIPNTTILLPSDAAQTEAFTRVLTHHDGPVYLRMGRNPIPCLYPQGCDVQIGRSITLHTGSDLALIATGEAVWHTLQAALLLERQGVAARVIDMPTIKPLDRATILEAAASTRGVVTVEEHSIHGGLGGAVAELLVEYGATPQKIIGFPDEFAPAGSAPELFHHYGISADAIAHTALDFLERRATRR